jgi:muramoyltetrapeptide carboxypeptidase
MMRKAPPLKPGDQVGLFVPASPVKENYRQMGLEQLAGMGYQCCEVGDILSGQGFAAKPAAERVRDIQTLLDDANIKALWAVRGGYGSNHLLPLMSRLKVTEAKIVVGSSDVSYLLWYMMDRLKWVVFYGPMAFASLAEGRADRNNLQHILSGDYDEIRVAGRPLIAGGCRAMVSGGCLSNLVSLIGTPYFPDLRGKILLLEDTNERPYRLDRMVWQLAQNGIFNQVAGILLGQFPQCFRDSVEKEDFLRRMQSYAGDKGYPVLYDMPFGHGKDIKTLPLGIAVEIDTEAYTGLIIREKGVQQ